MNRNHPIYYTSTESNQWTHYAHSCKQCTITTVPPHATAAFPFNNTWPTAKNCQGPSKVMMSSPVYGHHVLLWLSCSKFLCSLSGLVRPNLWWPKHGQCTPDWPSIVHALVSFHQNDHALSTLWSVSIKLIKHWPCSGQFLLDWPMRVIPDFIDHSMTNPLSTWGCLISCWSRVDSWSSCDQLLVMRRQPDHSVTFLLTKYSSS